MSPALVLQFLPYLFQAAEAVPQLIDYIKKLREHAAQSDEWRPQQEAEFDTQLADAAKQPWWQE